MANDIQVLGFAGSLRKGSYNRSLLRAAEELLPGGMQLETFDLSSIPMYDDDVRSAGYPEPVQRFREAIRSADAILIATPEYNYSVPGVLQNAIDWASRAPNQPFAGKPVAIMGATTGLWGTVRAQLQLRQIFATLDLHAVNKPEVLVANAKEKFDAEGKLTDEETRKFVKKLLEALLEWTRRLQTK